MPRLLSTGRLTPVCCVTDVSEKVNAPSLRARFATSSLAKLNLPNQFKDQFLIANIDYADQLDHTFVIVDSSSPIYTTKSDIGENTPSSPSSSFLNKTADECWLLLRALREAGADIDYESFVIIDERTLQDGTVLVVVKELLTEDEAAQATDASVRMPCKLASFRLLSYLSAEGDIAGDVVMAQRHEDGVLREDEEELTAEEEERLYGPFD